MDRKKLLPLLCAVCGILAGIGMICAAVLEEAFPKPLWCLIGIGFFVSAGGNLYNYYYFRAKSSEVITAMFCGCRRLRRRAKRLKSNDIIPVF